MSRRQSVIKTVPKPCFHCYKKGHPSDEKCTRHGLISCTNCFRLNVFTKQCNCRQHHKPSPPQVLRMVGNRRSPRWYVDLYFHEVAIPALLNTTISRCRVNAEFATWYQSHHENSIYQDADTIVIETKRKGILLQITCDVFNNQKEHIEVGTELMMVCKYQFTLENITIDSELSPVSSSPYETEYVYNLMPRGCDLRTYLNSKKCFLKLGRINKLRLKSSNDRTRVVTARRNRRSESSDQ